MHFLVKKYILYCKNNKENLLKFLRSPLIIALITCALTVILAPVVKNKSIEFFVARYVPKIDVSNDILTLFRNYTEAETRVISHVNISSPTVEAEKKILDEATISLTNKVGEIYGEGQQLELLGIMREFNSSQVEYIIAVKNRDKKRIGATVSLMSKFPKNLSHFIKKLTDRNTDHFVEIDAALRSYASSIKTVIDSYQTNNTRDILSSHKKALNSSDTLVRYIGIFFSK